MQFIKQAFGILSEGENVAGMKEEAIQATKCSDVSTKGTCGLSRCCVTCVGSPEKTFSKVETFGHYKLKGLEPTFACKQDKHKERITRT